MPTLLASSILEQDWKGASQFNGQSPFARNGTQRADDEGPWRPAIEKIVAMQQLGDNWDGLGAKAPARELLASVVGLAYLLKDTGREPPHAVLPCTNGSVSLVWEDSDGSYCEIEVTRPLFAEVFIQTPGQPSQYWTIPN